MKSIILGKHDGRQSPRLTPRQSPLNSVVDESAELEAEHAYIAEQARGWILYYEEVAEYHTRAAAACARIRKRAESLLWDVEAVEVAS